MVSIENASAQQRERLQADVEDAANRLGNLMGIRHSPDAIISAVRSIQQVDENKKVLLRFQREVFNGNDWSTETLRRNLTEDFVDHAAMPGDPPGFEGVQLRFSAWAAAFEDADEENMAVIGEQDLLAVMYNLHARHSGEFMGISPTLRDVVIPGMEVVRIRDGKIAEHWGIYDFLRTAEEIGANLAFIPRGELPGEPVRPQVPWAVTLNEADAPDVVNAAERYLRPDGNDTP
jgi:predicted ester cyclase